MFAHMVEGRRRLTDSTHMFAHMVEGGRWPTEFTHTFAHVAEVLHQPFDRLSERQAGYRSNNPVTVTSSTTSWVT